MSDTHMAEALDSIVLDQKFEPEPLNMQERRYIRSLVERAPETSKALTKLAGEPIPHQVGEAT